MKHLLEQGIKFIGLSGIGWILDFMLYTILGFIIENLFFNNLISSWFGVTFVFLFSTRVLFQNHSRIKLKWKYLLYLLYQCILIYLVSKVLVKVNQYILIEVNIERIKNFSSIISKIVITPITMILNFGIMKGIIEKI